MALQAGVIVRSNLAWFGVMTSDLEPIRRALVERGVEVGEIRRSAHHEYVWFYDLDSNRFELSRQSSAGAAAEGSHA